MATSTVEDYLKQLYLEQQKTDNALVAMGRLADAMHVAPGTVTAMIKTLGESGLVLYEPRGGVKLTHSGEQLALHVLRRHRLVELFLVEVVGLDWSQVHEEAEQLEHAISDTVLERIDHLLGRPSVDPHGDPIPTAAGQLNRARLVSLSKCKAGQHARIARVIDQGAGFLRFAEGRGLTPGVEVVVEQHDELADAITVQPMDRAPITIGTTAAAKIFVEAL